MLIKKKRRKRCDLRPLQILQFKEHLITTLPNDLINIIIEYTAYEPYIKDESCNIL